MASKLEHSGCCRRIAVVSRSTQAKKKAIQSVPLNSALVNCSVLVNWSVQLCMEPIGFSSIKIHVVNWSIWLFDQFLAAKTADPLSGPLCTKKMYEAEIWKDHWSLTSRLKLLNWSWSFVWSRSLQVIFSNWSWSLIANLSDQFVNMSINPLGNPLNRLGGQNLGSGLFYALMDIMVGVVSELSDGPKLSNSAF